MKVFISLLFCLKTKKVYMDEKIPEKIPYEFKKYEKSDVLIEDNEKMDIVRLMFCLCFDELNLGKIESVIESQGGEALAKYKKTKIVGWSLTEIRKILSDSIFGDERIQNCIWRGEIAKLMNKRNGCEI